MSDEKQRKFIELEVDGGNGAIAMLLEKETEEEYIGRILYTSMIDANVTLADCLETGRPIVVNKSDVLDVRDVPGPLTKRYGQYVEKRLHFKDLLIDTPEPIVQVIELVPCQIEDYKEAAHHDYTLCMNFMVALPNTKDVFGVPYVTQVSYYAKRESDSNIAKHKYLSWKFEELNGKIVPETKIMIGSDIICTIGDYSEDKLCMLGRSRHRFIADQYITGIRDAELHVVTTAVLSHRMG